MDDKLGILVGVSAVASLVAWGYYWRTRSAADLLMAGSQLSLLVALGAWLASGSRLIGWSLLGPAMAAVVYAWILRQREQAPSRPPVGWLGIALAWAAAAAAAGALGRPLLMYSFTIFTLLAWLMFAVRAFEARHAKNG